MKTIGLLGGMSWESTVTYYQLINVEVKKKLGGLHSARCVLYSVDFQEIEECQSKGEWKKSAEILSAAAQCLERAGAEFIVICTNTMHKVADEIENKISIPILHIAEVTAEELLNKEIQKTALLGTKYTMEQSFYKDRLHRKGIQVVIPEEEDRKVINDIIFQELCLGIISEESKKKFVEILYKLKEEGCQAAVLGCTEIGLLIKQEDTDLLLVDTTEVHARKAAEIALMDISFE